MKSGPLSMLVCRVAWNGRRTCISEVIKEADSYDQGGNEKEELAMVVGSNWHKDESLSNR